MKRLKGLHPAAAFALMLLMLCCALCVGTHKHWKGETEKLTVQTLSLETAMDVRAETAQNLLSVALRHLPADDALCISVSSARAAIANPALPLHERREACDRLTAQAQQLLKALSSLPSVQSDSRDQMYAALMLPQAVELTEDVSAFHAYDQAAEAYNKALGSTFSGFLAQLIGYEKAPRIDGMQPAWPLDDRAVSYPSPHKSVHDDAAVLGSETADDIDKLNARMDSAAFTVATRHFLGGADVREYGKGLFDHWQLDDDDVLVLLVIGEERYAVMTGDTINSYISDEQLGSLTGTHLRAPFIAQRDYDRAVGDFLLAISGHIARASGEQVETGGLFGTAEKAQTALFDNWSGNWWEGFFSENDYDDKKADRADDGENDDETDLSTLLVLAFILIMIVRSRRKNRKDGLGWFGWLIAIAIISELGDMISRMLA